MSEQINKPYVLKAAEKIYFNVCKIKDENQLDPWSVPLCPTCVKQRPPYPEVTEANCRVPSA